MPTSTAQCFSCSDSFIPSDSQAGGEAWEMGDDATTAKWEPEAEIPGEGGRPKAQRFHLDGEISELLLFITNNDLHH